MNDDDIERKTIENLKDIINPHFCLEIIKDKIAKIVLTEPRARLKKSQSMDLMMKKLLLLNWTPRKNQILTRR